MHIRRNYVLIVLGRSALMFVSGFLAWYMPLKIEEEFGPGVLGLIFSAASAASIVVGSLGGVLSDGVGRKPVVVLDSALTLFGVVLLVLGCTALPILLPVSALVIYGFARIGDAAAEALIYESVDVNALGRALSAMFAAGSIAAGAGSIVLGYAVRKGIGYAAALLIISASLYVLTSILIKETLNERKGVFRCVDVVHRLGGAVRALIDVLRRAEEGFLLLTITALMSLGIGSTVYLYPAFMKEVKGFSEDVIASIYGAIPLLQTLLYPFAGVAVDRLGAEKATSIALLAMGAANACFVALNQPAYAGAALAAASALGALYNVAYRALLIQRAPREAKASGIALANTVWDVVGVFAPSVGALLWTLNPYLPFCLAVLIPITLSAISLAIG